jgi:aerobic carbon-monoxide dehydrogenase medium subunit
MPVMRQGLRFAGHPPIRNRTTVGGSVAHADSASELPTILAVVDGSVTLASTRGRRTVRWDDFLVGTFMTAREPDEVVVGLEFPVPPRMRFGFDEVARRHGDFALVGACVGIEARDGLVAAARIALFGVAGRPLRPRSAEELLLGQPLGGDWERDLGAAVREELEPLDDIHASAAYRRAVGATLVSRLAKLLSREGAE